MSKFNSDLNNLFSNWQNQQKYNKKAYDVNGDKKINSNDKNQLSNNEKNLLKKSTLFDINGDGKFNQADIDMFIKSDVNGDEKITQDEINFVSSYKKELITAFTKQKVDFELDGKKYVQGKLATGVYDGKYYKNGVLSDGTVSGKKYVKGLLANGIISGTLYKGGVTYTGLHTDNKYYKNGKVFTGVVENKYYKNGILSTGTYSGKYYVNGILANGTYNGKLYTNGALANGVIDNKFYKNGVLSDGTVSGKKYVKGELAQGVISNILYRDGVTYTGLHTDNKYYKNGKVFTGVVENKYYKNGILSTGTYSGKYYVNGIIANGTYNNKLYTNGALANGVMDNKFYKNGVLSDGTVSGKKYVKGELAQGVISNILYRDGVTYTGTYTDNRYYKNGKIFTGTENGKYYKDGIIANGIIGNDLYKEGVKIASADIIEKYLSEGTQFRISSIKTATITDRLIEDINIAETAEKAAKKAGKEGSAAYNNAYNASIKAQMIKTPSNMKNVAGEVVEKTDGLYVNDGSKLVKLNISAETYLKLFPPIKRYDINQGNIGDCYFISGCLIDMMKNPKAFSQLMQQFSEDKNGNISIKFSGTLSQYSPVIFEKGKLKVVDGKVDGNKVKKYTQVKGSLGIQMIEQAYAISRFAEASSREISTIDIDEAIPAIVGGWAYYVYKEVLNTESEYSSINATDTVDLQIIKDNKQFIDSIEYLIIDYIESSQNLEKAEEQIKKLTPNFYAFEYIMNSNKEGTENPFTSCIVNGNVNVDKFKESISKLVNTKNSLYSMDFRLKQFINRILKMEDLDIKNVVNAFINTDYCNLVSIKEKAWSTYIDSCSNKGIDEKLLDQISIKAYTSDEEVKEIGLYEALLKDNSYTTKNVVEDLFNEYATKVNNGEIFFSLGFRGTIPEYNIVDRHAYSVEKIDTENETVYITNPWYGGGTIAVPYNIIVQAIEGSYMNYYIGNFT